MSNKKHICVSQKCNKKNQDFVCIELVALGIENAKKNFFASTRIELKTERSFTI